MITVHIQYFALLREQRGLAQETLTTTATDAAALYAELRVQHGFTLLAERVRAAVRGDFVPWTHALRDGDEVVFIPPVAGG
jgi:molybdopterin converting factor subunit 1